MPMNYERRRYFRIQDSVQLKLLPVDEASLESLIQQFHNQPPARTSLHEIDMGRRQQVADLDRIRQQNPELGRYLESMQRQLDQLVERCSGRTDDFVDPSPVAVNLSAQGIAFASHSCLDPDSMVELHLRLRPAERGIAILARVVRCRADATATDMYRVALNFEHILEADRQRVARHVFDQQRLALVKASA
jgi:hypothetical protein